MTFLLFFCLHSTPQSSVDSQITYPERDLSLSNSGKTALELPSEPIVKSFIDEIKNPNGTIQFLGSSSREGLIELMAGGVCDTLHLMAGRVQELYTENRGGHDLQRPASSDLFASAKPYLLKDPQPSKPGKSGFKRA